MPSSKFSLSISRFMKLNRRQDASTILRPTIDADGNPFNDEPTTAPVYGSGAGIGITRSEPINGFNTVSQSYLRPQPTNTQLNLSPTRAAAGTPAAGTKTASTRQIPGLHAESETSHYRPTSQLSTSIGAHSTANSNPPRGLFGNRSRSTPTPDSGSQRRKDTTTRFRQKWTTAMRLPTQEESPEEDLEEDCLLGFDDRDINSGSCQYTTSVHANAYPRPSDFGDPTKSRFTDPNGHGHPSIFPPVSYAGSLNKPLPLPPVPADQDLLKPNAIQNGTSTCSRVPLREKFDKCVERYGVVAVQEVFDYLLREDDDGMMKVKAMINRTP